MKIRYGFVSNSSSSSFVLPLRCLTALQLKQLEDHGKEAGGDAWSIHVTNLTVEGSTGMNNFDMHDFMWKIGVNPEDAEWENDG